MTARLLLRYPLLRLLSPAQLHDWLAAGQQVDCPAGQTLIQENTPGAWVHLVLSGRVRILRQSGRRELTLGMLQAGDIFGEYALLPPGNNTATCRTAATTRLVRLPLEPLRGWLAALPAVTQNLKNWLRLHTLLHFHRERSFLGFMSGESALKLHDRLLPSSILAGQTIQATGLAEDTWFLIDQGTVRLHPGGAPDSATTEIGPGDSFGEPALLGASALPTAVAVTDVRCLALTRPVFDPAAPARSRVAQSYEPLTPARPEEHVWVPQRDKSDCGLAALAMVARRLGLAVGVAELRDKVALAPDGLTLQQLRELAAHIGLPCQSACVGLDRLGQVSPPVIAHLSTGHYIVLHEFCAAGVVVGDPATGIVTWNRAALAQVYSGAMLLFGHPGASVGGASPG